MNGRLKIAFDAEIRIAKRHLDESKLESAFKSLERAHVLGQQCVLPHALCHWLFLRIGWARKSPSEMRGQLLRLLLGTFGSAFGHVPVGNTGGSNISMFRTLPISPELQEILDPEGQRVF